MQVSAFLPLGKLSFTSKRSQRKALLVSAQAFGQLCPQLWAKLFIVMGKLAHRSGQGA